MGLPNMPTDVMQVSQDFILFAFASEFICRWYAAQLKPSYLVEFLSLIDIFVVIIPLLCKLFHTDVNIQSGLTNLLLLRILSLQRVTTDVDTFTKFVCALGLQPRDVRPYQLQLARVILSIF